MMDSIRLPNASRPAQKDLDRVHRWLHTYGIVHDCATFEAASDTERMRRLRQMARDRDTFYRQRPITDARARETRRHDL